MFIVYADNNEIYSSFQIWVVGIVNDESEADLICHKLNTKFNELKATYSDFWDIPLNELLEFDKNLEFNEKTVYKFQKVSQLELYGLKKIKLFNW